MDKQVYTHGVMILFTRAKMWCVRTQGKLRASNSIDSLVSYLSDPEARLGVWVESKYIDVDDINSYTWQTMKGFVDLDSGEFFKAGYVTAMNEYDTNDATKTEQEVIKRITEHMLEKWQKKFVRNQKI